MKIIFLDVDGVLNSEKHYRKRGEPDYRWEDEPPYPLSEFDSEAVALLNRIIKETDAKIVVSSTWRIGRSVDELKELFKNVGVEGEIIDKTKILRERRGYERVVRGTEIRRWIEEFEDESFENYIIIDDDGDMLPSQKKDHFVKTSFWFGLTEEDVEKAVSILNS